MGARQRQAREGAADAARPDDGRHRFRCRAGAVVHEPRLHRLGRRRLTGQGLWTVIKSLGRGAGIEVRPHGIRHASITAALDLTRGDVRAVQKHSRHSSVAVLMRYDDNRVDMAGTVAAMVAAEVGVQDG